MKVLLAIPGHLYTVPMSRYCAAALRRLRHEVVVFDYRPRWQDKVRMAWERRRRGPNEEVRAADRRLCRLAQRERPDFFLTLCGFDIGREAIQCLRELGSVTACWWLNDPFQLPRSLCQASWYDVYFTNSRGSVGDYQAAGVRAVHFLPTAADPSVHVRRQLAEDETGRYESDVCFAGDWSPLREDWIGRLLDRHRLKVWGPWGKKLAAGSPIRRVLVDGFFTPTEMVKAFTGAKVVLNLHGWYGRWPYGVNPRLFEAAGTGVCQLVDHMEEIPDLYRVGEEVVCFGSFEECERLLDHYLTREAERKAIGARASARTHQDHTYDVRLKTLLHIAGNGRTGT